MMHEYAVIVVADFDGFLPCLPLLSVPCQPRPLPDARGPFSLLRFLLRENGEHSCSIKIPFFAFNFRHRNCTRKTKQQKEMCKNKKCLFSYCARNSFTSKHTHSRAIPIHLQVWERQRGTRSSEEEPKRKRAKCVGRQLYTPEHSRRTNLEGAASQQMTRQWGVSVHWKILIVFS